MAADRDDRRSARNEWRNRYICYNKAEVCKSTATVQTE